MRVQVLRTWPPQHDRLTVILRVPTQVWRHDNYVWTTKEEVTYIPLSAFHGQAMASLCEHAALSKSYLDVDWKSTTYGYELTRVGPVADSVEAP